MTEIVVPIDFLGDVATLSTDRLIGNKIQLYTQKTGVPVYCVLPQFVADLLECLPRISDRYFFWTGNSTIHTVNGIWQRTLQALFKRAEITNGFAHRFRDSFSVSLLLAGVPIEQVSILLGHSNIRVTQQHYNPWFATANCSSKRIYNVLGIETQSYCLIRRLKMLKGRN